jgi:hypothetical protein
MPTEDPFFVEKKRERLRSRKRRDIARKMHLEGRTQIDRGTVGYLQDFYPTILTSSDLIEQDFYNRYWAKNALAHILDIIPYDIAYFEKRLAKVFERMRRSRSGHVSYHIRERRAANFRSKFLNRFIMARKYYMYSALKSLATDIPYEPAIAQYFLKLRAFRTEMAMEDEERRGQ